MFSGYKSFEIINIKNSSIPTVSVPDYPDHIDGAAEIVYDPAAGVVRACGGLEYSNEVDKCFTYDGLQWSEMAPTCEPWYPGGDQSQRFSFFIPNIGWWWMLRDSCGANCNRIHTSTVAFMKQMKIQFDQKKRTTYIHTAITPFKIDEITKAGRALKRAGAELSNTYDNFSGTQLGAEIFEFKDDPVPKILCKKY